MGVHKTALLILCLFASEIVFSEMPVFERDALILRKNMIGIFLGYNCSVILYNKYTYNFKIKFKSCLKPIIKDDIIVLFEKDLIKAINLKTNSIIWKKDKKVLNKTIGRDGNIYALMKDKGNNLYKIGFLDAKRGDYNQIIQIRESNSLYGIQYVYDEKEDYLIVYGDTIALIINLKKNVIKSKIIYENKGQTPKFSAKIKNHILYYTQLNYLYAYNIQIRKILWKAKVIDDDILNYHKKMDCDFYIMDKFISEPILYGRDLIIVVTSRKIIFVNREGKIMKIIMNNVLNELNVANEKFKWLEVVNAILHNNKYLVVTASPWVKIVDLRKKKIICSIMPHGLDVDAGIFSKPYWKDNHIFIYDKYYNEIIDININIDACQYRINVGSSIPRHNR